MSVYFSIQAALFFALSHIAIRRGLATSNAITGSFISLMTTCLITWVLAFLFVPFESFRTPAIWYFMLGGVFAPGLGRILTFSGIERIGVARSVPIVNCSPLFASILAVFLMEERWPLQNVFGTCLVISGVVILSGRRPEEKEWRLNDLLFPLAGALAFGISTNLRKLGLLAENIPLMASAVTATTAVLFAGLMVRLQGGRKAIRLSQGSLGWFIVAGCGNGAAMISVFYALSSGRIVVVEPLVATNPILTIILSAIFLRDVEAITARVALGALCTVAGTILVVTL
ncbi:MAG: DMT family transporter [Candidatus Binatia bacterium]